MRRAVLVIALGMACRPGPSTEDRAPQPQARTDGSAREQAPVRTTPASTDAVPSERARSTATTEPDPLTAPASRSTSIGTCTEGRLEGGLPLPLTAAGLLFHPDKDPGSRFGTVELVGGLVRAAAAVERARAGAPLTVSDLSREGGGEISRHASHRSGRDVDVLFYLRRARGEPFVPAKAIPLDPEGRGTDYGDLTDPADDVPVELDAARTWSFVAALLADEAIAVQRIFVVEHVRGRLLAEARRVEAPAEVIQRFAEVTCQPGFPHDDHMHIRVSAAPRTSPPGASMRRRSIRGVLRRSRAPGPGPSWRAAATTSRHDPRWPRAAPSPSPTSGRSRRRGPKPGRCTRT